MNKRILSIVLVLSLCLTLLPATVLAADPIPSTGLSFSGTLPTAETVYTAGGGTITYKPASGNDSARLILDNADINAADGAAISLGNNEFVIELHGRNTLIGKIGIYSNTNLTITSKDTSGVADADAQLTVYAKGNDNAKDAVYSRGAITVDGGSYYITSRYGSVFSAADSTTIKNADARFIGDGGSSTIYGQLTVENTTLSVTANGAAPMISGGSLILNSGADMTVNSAAEINFAADKFLTVNSGATFTLAPCTVMTFNNNGVLNNSGTFVNNGTLNFDGSSVLTVEELTQKGITGTGLVYLNETVYTNSGTAVKITDADLDLGTLSDSNDLALNGYILATDSATGGKTLTLGNVKLGTVTLPADASVTIAVADGYSAYADKITSSGSSPLTFSGSGTLAVLEGVTLSGNLTVDGPSVTAIGTPVKTGTNLESYGITMNNGGDILVSSGTLTAAGSELYMGDGAVYSGGIKLGDSSDLTVTGSNSKLTAIGNVATTTSDSKWTSFSRGIYIDNDANNCTINVDNGGVLIAIGGTVGSGAKAYSSGIYASDANVSVNVDGTNSKLIALAGNAMGTSLFYSSGIFLTGNSGVNVTNAGKLIAAAAVATAYGDYAFTPNSYGIYISGHVNVSGTGSVLNAVGCVAIAYGNPGERYYLANAKSVGIYCLGTRMASSVNVSGNNSMITAFSGAAIGETTAESSGVLFQCGGNLVVGSDNVTSGTLIAKGGIATLSGAYEEYAFSQGILFQYSNNSVDSEVIVNGNLDAESSAALTTSNNAFAKSYGIGFYDFYKSITLTVNGGYVKAKSGEAAGADARTNSAALYFTGGTNPALTVNNGLKIAKPSNGLVAKDGDYWTVKSGDTVAKDVFISRVFTVTLNTNGGTINNGNVTDYAQGLGATLPTADNMTYTGYAFDGWYDNGNLTGTPVTEIGTAETGNKNFYAKWRDITGPTGEIKLGSNTWTDFINVGNISFDLFFKNKKQVGITASDNSGDAVVIGYLLSDEKLTETELESKTFTTYSGPFDIEPNNDLIVYAKLTDQTGNSSYISSNGIVLDNTKPTVTGIEDGKIYCAAQTFTASDAHGVNVMVNGEPVTLTGNSSYTLSPAEDPYTVVATDEAGNASEITVTVNDGHRGGYPTCVSGNKCENCGEEYGVIDSDRHDIEKVSAVDATVIATGNTEYWKCKNCGKIFSDEDGKNEINISDTVIPKLPPEIIEGNGQSVSLGENRSLTFRSNAAYSDFIRVEVDGKTVDEKNYTKKEGSTLVTLKAEYVESLPVGEHTLGIVSESGTATTVFTVNPKADTDKGLLNTGDSSNAVLLCAITLVSGGTVAVVCSYGKKSKRYRVK